MLPLFALFFLYSFVTILKLKHRQTHLFNGSNV